MHYHAKLTKREVQQVWKLYWVEGWTQKRIATKYRVTQPTIYSIVHRQLYKPITDVLYKHQIRQLRQLLRLEL